MNTKRQTIWLVSMLSLMVVLSAYYLFTEDSGKLKVTDENTGTQNITVDTKETSPTPGKTPAGAQTTGGKTTTDAKTNGSAATGSTTIGATGTTGTTATSSTSTGTTKSTDGKSSGTTATDSKTTGTTSTGAAATGAASTGSKTSDTKSGDGKKTDAEVLKQVQTQNLTGADYFTAMQLKRNEDLSKETERLMTIITDSKQNTEAVSKAYDDINTIQQREEQMNSIEETLGKDYHNAIVLQEENKWKVVVQGDKLDKSQAVGIVDLVMKEMNVGPDKVTVQLMHP